MHGPPDLAMYAPRPIGFDDNRSLGTQRTGGRVALPVFKELVLRVYREGPVPEFPAQREQNINGVKKQTSSGFAGGMKSSRTLHAKRWSVANWIPAPGSQAGLDHAD